MNDNLNPALTQYFKEVKQFPLPSKAEEIALFTAYKKADTQALLGASAHARQEGNALRTQLSQKIVCGYLRFVIQQARRKTSDPDLLGDLIAQGHVGLLVSVKKFDLDYKVRFLTYAANWVNVYIQEYLHKLGIVHVPSHTRKAISKRRKNPEPELSSSWASELPEISDQPVEDLNIVSEDSADDRIHMDECNVFALMDQADLTRPEKMALTYGYGLRDVELSTLDISQLFYELDGSLCSVYEIEKLKTEGLSKLQSLCQAKGIATLSDIW